MYLAYIAGKACAPSEEEVELNIIHADYVARDVAALGYTVFCSHKNWRGWLHDDRFSHETLMELDLAILPRCDLLVLVPGWEASEGACAERAFAELNGIPVYECADAPHADVFVPSCAAEAKVV